VKKILQFIDGIIESGMNTSKLLFVGGKRWNKGNQESLRTNLKSSRKTDRILIARGESDLKHPPRINVKDFLLAVSPLCDSRVLIN
jgi:hypothetical protein